MHKLYILTIKNFQIYIAVITLFLVSTGTLFACSNNNQPATKNLEVIPEISLTTAEGKITSEKFLEDSKGEFLLFISPNWGTCISELRKLALSDNGMSDFANIYIIGMNPGYSIERLKSMWDSGPNWIYAMPSDTETLSKVAGLTRSTKILLGSNNEVLGRYRMGQWNLEEWVEIFRDI